MPPPTETAASEAAPQAVYLVGGAVRDALLGLPIHDRDYVVTGTTPEELIADGFLPVGKDFPVFLHPSTHEQVALARTERKTAAGYHGFAFHAAPSVRIEDDLARRDLAINAIAIQLTNTATSGKKPVKNDAKSLIEAAANLQANDWLRLPRIDPHNGQQDLQHQTLRHVTDAFAEDPVRILRLARFAARFTAFSVAPDTTALMQRMVSEGEVDALVTERVWQEISRGLMAEKPSRMWDVLRSCGALKRLAPEIDALWGVPQPPEHHPEVDTGVHLGLVLDVAARANMPLEVRYALLCHDLGKATTPAAQWPKHHGHGLRSAKLAKRLGERWRVPQACTSLADVVAMEHGNIHGCMGFGAAAVVRLFERCDAFRRPQRFAQALDACACDARGRGAVTNGLAEHETKPYPQREWLLNALQACQSIDAKLIATNSMNMATTASKDIKNAGEMIQKAIHDARVAALQASWAASAA